MAEIRLPDLEVIRAYSIAVRRERADAAEVAELLRRDLAFVQAAAGARPRATAPEVTPPVARTQETVAPPGPVRPAARPASPVRTPARAPEIRTVGKLPVIPTRVTSARGKAAAAKPKPKADGPRGAAGGR